MPFDVKAAVRGLLNNNGLRRVAVIDDAFDDPSPRHLESEIKGFFKFVEEEDCFATLHSHDIPIEAVEQIDGSILSKLLSAELDGELADARTRLFLDYNLRKNELQRFCDELTELGLEVVAFQSDVDLTNQDAYDLVFLDYDLDGGPAQSGEHAKEIYKKHQSFVILMSDKFDGDEVKFRFREEHKLLRGFFQFVRKSELFQFESFCPRLTLLPIEMTVRHTIHEFVDTLASEMEKIKDSFLSQVRDLGLEDYSYIEKLSLNAEDHPLGDYMLRLFSEYLQSKTYENESLFAAARKLDELEYLEYQPLTESPTSSLADIYTGFLSHKLHADDFATHAKLEGDNLPWLQLGDVLIKNTEEPVFVIVNAPCDLQFGPTRVNRHDDDTVLLLPGYLRKLNDYSPTDRKPFKTTPLFEFEGESYRIEWDYQKLRTEPHNRIRNVFENNGYSHGRRLRLGAAFELQSAFVRMIGRLGIDVPPPIGKTLEFNVYSRSVSDKPTLIGKVQNGAVSFHRRAEDHDVFALNFSGQQEISRILAEYEPALSEDIASEVEDENNKELLVQLKRFRNGIKNRAKRISVICPFVKEPTMIPLEGNAATKDRISVVTSVDIEKNWDPNTWLLIELLVHQPEQMEVQIDQQETN